MHRCGEKACIQVPRVAWPGAAATPVRGIRLSKLPAPIADGCGRHGDAAFRLAFCHGAGIQAEENEQHVYHALAGIKDPPRHGIRWLRGARPQFQRALSVAAGGIVSSANDMLKFIAANLGLTNSPLAASMQKHTRSSSRAAGIVSAWPGVIEPMPARKSSRTAA